MTIEQILAAHNKAVGDMAMARQEMRAAHQHIVSAMRSMEAWASAHDAAADAQDLAIAAMMDANRAAISLLHDKPES